MPFAGVLFVWGKKVLSHIRNGRVQGHQNLYKGSFWLICLRQANKLLPKQIFNTNTPSVGRLEIKVIVLIRLAS